MEKTKIKSYSEFKKFLFCMYLSQSLLLILGKNIDKNVDNLKKNFQKSQKIPELFQLGN